MVQRTSFLLFLFLTLVFTACGTIAGPRQGALSPCIQRDGACFDVVVDGVTAARLHDRSVLSRYEATAGSAWKHADVGYTEWIVTNPISGYLNVNVYVNYDGQDWFGDNLQTRVRFLPLEGQQIRSQIQVQQSNSVRAARTGLATVSSVSSERKLPSGDYLVRVDLNGSRNWDRKTIFVTVQ
ncbi:MAG: hypothetical protein KDD62_08525 [Bdellovibrionales bacterium]|nr:hypothetical protein [Bdellovibrionales bacterium]